MKRFGYALLISLVLVAGCSETSTDGAALYGRYCGACHGADLAGGVGPALDAGSPASRLPSDALRSVILQGVPGMPATTGLDDAQLDALITFLAEAQAR